MSIVTMPTTLDTPRRTASAILAGFDREDTDYAATSAREALDANEALQAAVRAEADAYRARGTDFGAFLGNQLHRLADLLNITKATNGRDHESRFEALEMQARFEWQDRGFMEGRASCPCRADFD